MPFRQNKNQEMMNYIYIFQLCNGPVNKSYESKFEMNFQIKAVKACQMSMICRIRMHLWVFFRQNDLSWHFFRLKYLNVRQRPSCKFNQVLLC